MARNENERATSIDVAKRAGVSQATVSRVFSGDNAVRESTKQRVLQAAEELNYKPNRLARSLSSAKSDIIAVVVSNVRNRFYSEMLSYLATMLQQRSKQVLFFQMPSVKDASDIINRVAEYRVDGIVLASPALPEKIQGDCMRTNVPIVMFNREVEGLGIYSVCNDSVKAGCEVADLLLKRHYNRFAFIGSKVGTSSGNRERAFINALKERGINDIAVINGDYNYKFGAYAIKKLYETEKNPPNAVFCANDVIAMGVIDAARNDLHLRVPQDLGVVGFDDVEEAGFDSYSLTSVRQPFKQMVHATCRFLFAEENREIIAEKHLRFPCELIERNSTGQK